MAIDFDGTNDYIDCGSSIIKNVTQFSVLLRFHTDSTAFAKMLVWEGYSGGNGWSQGNPRSTYSEFQIGRAHV